MSAWFIVDLSDVVSLSVLVCQAKRYLQLYRHAAVRAHSLQTDPALLRDVADDEQSEVVQLELFFELDVELRPERLVCKYARQRLDRQPVAARDANADADQVQLFSRRAAALHAQELDRARRRRVRARQLDGEAEEHGQDLLDLLRVAVQLVGDALVELQVDVVLVVGVRHPDDLGQVLDRLDQVDALDFVVGAAVRRQPRYRVEVRKVCKRLKQVRPHADPQVVRYAGCVRVHVVHVFEVRHAVLDARQHERRLGQHEFVFDELAHHVFEREHVSVASFPVALKR